MKIARLHVLPFAAALFFTITQPSCTREAKKGRSLEAAFKHFESGAFSAAEIEYKNALAAEPDNAEALKRIGIIRLRQGSAYEAAGRLKYAKEKLPKDNEIGLNLAKALLSLGYMPGSRKELLEILDRSPDNGEALLLLAETSIKPEMMDECEQRIKAAGKKSVSSQLASALIALRRGSIEPGTAMVDEVLKSNPDSARAHALKASILAGKKLPDEALAERKLAAESAGLRSDESIAYARELMSRERRDDAVAYLEKLTAGTPDFLPAWALLGQIAYFEKKDEAATKYLSNVLSKNPFDLNTSLMQAEILVRGKEPGKAVELLEKLAGVLSPPAKKPEKAENPEKGAEPLKEPLRSPVLTQIDFALSKCLIAADNLPKAAAALDRVLKDSADLTEAAKDSPDLTEAAKSSPYLTEAGRMRAMIHLRDGKTLEAIAALEKIRIREPQDEPTRDLLIRAYRSSGRNDAAIALLREKSDANKEDPNSRIELGQLLSSQGKLDEARSIFEKSGETFTASLEAVSNLADLDLKSGKGESALKRIEDYIVAHPESSAAYTFKAAIALDIKKPDLAEQSLQKAIELKADNLKAHGLLLQLKSGPGQEKEALAVLDRYLKSFPKDPQARLQRSFLLQQVGKNEESRTALLELIAAAPEQASPYNNLASLEADAFHNLESAANYARKARSIDGAHPAIADTLGWIEWQLKNYPAALALLTEAAGKMSKNPTVLYHLGMAQYSMGQSDEATTSFTKALESGSEFPEKSDAQKHLSLLREASKAVPADLENLRKRVADNPEDVMAYLQLAGLLAREGKPQEAMAAYQKVLDLNPKIPAAFVGQASLYSGPLNSPDKALQAASKARELAPRDPSVLAALGLAKMMTGAHEEAYGLLKDASVRLDNDPIVAFNYARAAYSLGRIAEARAAMTRAASSESATSAAAKKFLILTDSGGSSTTGIATVVEETLAKDPEDVPALMLRSSLETAAGTSPEATLLKILALQPRFDPARVRLAAFYMEDPAKLDQALSLAREARNTMRDDQELTRIVAVISYRKGDFKYAGQSLAELSTKRPLGPDELLILGLSLAKSDQPEKARTTLDQALKAGLSDLDADQAKAALSKLDNPEAPKK